MTLILALALVAAVTATPDPATCLCPQMGAASDTPNLVIQVVTEDWLPHPNATVKISGKFQGNTSRSITMTSDRSGVVCIRVPYDALYAVDVPEQAGFAAVHRDVRLLPEVKGLPTAYVQIVTTVKVRTSK